MKQILLFIGLLVSLLGNGQNLHLKIDDGIFLTGNQWHYDNLSILEANYNYYLIITPKEYYYHKLDDFDPEPFFAQVNDSIVRYTPYVYKNQVGWFILGRVLSYFYGSDKKVTTLHPRPVMYGYHYYVCRKTQIDLSRWHWYYQSTKTYRRPKRRAGNKTDVPKYVPMFEMKPPHFKPQYKGYNYLKNKRL